MSFIPFTQYLMPHGRKSPVSIDMPDEIAAKAQQIIARGLRFECEMLTTGEISLTIHDPDSEEDIDIEVIPNGPEVPVAVERLVQRNAKAAS